MKFLMCSAEYYEIAYEINPWMDIDKPPSKKLANEQWQNLVNLIKFLGGSIFTMSGEKNLPDIIFTANAGVIRDNKVLLSKFKFKERQPEKEFYKKWFEENGFNCLETNLDFEGAGDILYSNDICYFGYGFRTNKDVYYEQSEFFGPNVVFAKLINPYFYHLDTCFCPLSRDDALVFPGAFDKTYFKSMENNLNLIIVPEEDAYKFACNAVCLDKNVIIPEGCYETTHMLIKNGYHVHTLNLDQFALSGGSAKCLSLRLD